MDAINKMHENGLDNEEREKRSMGEDDDAESKNYLRL